MASIESRIDTFISENKLDTEMKECICDLVNGCISDLFKHLYSSPVPEKPKKDKKESKEKIENPSSVQSRDELRNCNTQTLNQFCKDNNLKIGGNKTDVMDRVWRFLQGEASDEDISSKAKPKKEKQVAEKHVCAGKNAKGVACASAGTELCGEVHLCWRHAKSYVPPEQPEVIPETEVKKKDKKEKTKSKRMEKIIKKFEADSEELVTDDE